MSLASISICGHALRSSGGSDRLEEHAGGLGGNKHCTALGAISGAVAGLVAITSGFRLCHPLSQRFVDRADRRRVFCYLMVVKVKAVFGYDDSLDAFGVHGAGGTSAHC